MEFEHYFHELKSPGYITAKVPAEIMRVFDNAVNDVKLNGGQDMAHRLAGHLDNQINLMNRKDCVDAITPFVYDLARLYDMRFDYMRRFQTREDDQLLYLQALWLNLQKKHEFNPLHKHGGVYSFAIWHTIPYDINDEINMFKTKHSKASCFEFGYVDALGLQQFETIPVNKSYEGVICFFPAVLHHGVYPFFTSDDYRISIAGNLYFKS
jgi:hypothetical protein